MAETIRESDFWKKGHPLAFIGNLIGLRTGPEILALAAYLVIPTAVMFLVTRHEGVFAIGSVKTEVDGMFINGMSYLGDTMTWPFVFISALGLLLLKSLVRCCTRLISDLRERGSTGWLHDKENGYLSALADLKKILSYENGKKSTVLLVMPWLIAGIFWIYNTGTCAFHDYLGAAFYPYKKVVTVSDAAGPVHETTVNMPKWDCNRETWPASCIASRVWAAVFYTIPVVMLFYFINIVWAVTAFLRRIRNWEKTVNPQNDGALLIKPFSGGRFGGLELISETGMAFLYFISLFLLFLAMAFLKEGITPQWHNYLLLASFVPLSVFAYLSPTLAIRNSILEAKKMYLGKLAKEIGAAAEALLEGKDGMADAGNAQAVYYKLASLKMLHEKTEAIAEWPFTYSIIARIVLSIGAPLLIVLLEGALKNIMPG